MKHRAGTNKQRMLTLGSCLACLIIAGCVPSSRFLVSSSQSAGDATTKHSFATQERKAVQDASQDSEIAKAKQNNGNTTMIAEDATATKRQFVLPQLSSLPFPGRWIEFPGQRNLNPYGPGGLNGPHISRPQCKQSNGRVFDDQDTWIENALVWQCNAALNGLSALIKPLACVDSALDAGPKLPGTRWERGGATFQCSQKHDGTLLITEVDMKSVVVVPQTPGKQTCSANGRTYNDGETFREGQFMKQCVSSANVAAVQIIRCLDSKQNPRNPDDKWTDGLTEYVCAKDINGGLTIRPVGAAPTIEKVVVSPVSLITAVPLPSASVPLHPHAMPPTPPQTPPSPVAAGELHAMPFADGMGQNMMGFHGPHFHY